MNTIYDGKHKEKNIVRRRRRILKCADIFLTYEPSSKKLRSMFEKWIRNGMLSIGHHVNPELISKPSAKNNAIEKFAIYCLTMQVHNDNQIIKIYLEEQENKYLLKHLLENTTKTKIQSGEKRDD